MISSQQVTSGQALPPGYCPRCGAARLDQRPFCADCGERLLVTPLSRTPPTLRDPIGAPAPRTKPRAEPRPERLGAYTIRKLIGEGGQGATYEAEQTALGRSVCIKVLHPHLASDLRFAARFALEGRATAAIRHPNVVSVFDVGAAADGSSFIVMELVEGQQLREVLKEHGALEWRRAVAMVDQVLAGLAEAHANNIVHCDLKPSNVLVTRLRDGSELVKVVDFGIATVMGLGDVGTALEEFSGTPGYAAPEQLLGQPADARSDLFSVGIVLWEMLAGVRLFPTVAGLESALKLREQPPKAPSLVSGRALPSRLDAVVLQALQQEPTARFADTTAFRQALREVVEEQQRVVSFRLGATPPSEPALDAVIVGRQTEFERFQRLLGSVTAQQPAGLVITGRKGLGKTRLLHELERLARRIGFVVVRLNAAEAGGDRLALINGVLTRLKTALPPDPLSAGVSSSDTSRAMKTLLHAAEAVPLVLLVDDVDQADAHSVEFLDELLVRASNRRLGMVVTTRAQHTRLLPRSPRLALSELTPSATTRLIRQLLPSGSPTQPLVDLLATQGHGNPWLVNLLLSSLIQSGHVEERGGKWFVNGRHEMLTDAAQFTVAVELEKLPGDAQQVLLVGALQGRRFMADLATQLLGATKDVPACHAKCVEAGWLSRVDDTRFEFEEPLTHQALRSMLSLAQMSLVADAITGLLAFDVPANPELLANLAGALFAASVLAPSSERAGFFAQLTALFEALAAHRRFSAAIDTYEAVVAQLRSDATLTERGGDVARQLRAWLLGPAFIGRVVDAMGAPEAGDDAESALRRIARASIPVLLALIPQTTNRETRSRLAAVAMEASTDLRTTQALAKHLDARQAEALAGRARSFDVERAAPIFAQLLSSTDSGIRRAGATLAPTAVVPMLGKHLVFLRVGDPDARVRLAFLERVAEAEEPSAFDPVVQLLQNVELELTQRAAAYAALAAIDPERALDRIATDIESHPNVEARLVAVQSLTGVRTARSMMVLEDLAKRVWQHPRVRAAARDALRQPPGARTPPNGVAVPRASAK